METMSTASIVRSARRGPSVALALHWPEYLMEAAALGLFMLAACAFGVLLEHPMSPLHQAIDNSLIRRSLMGLALGGTALGIIYSPWGQQSGAHMNPAVTLSFLALRKIDRWDALFYIASQFLGGLAGVTLADLAIGFPLRHSAVNYVATVPGVNGLSTAFSAEFAISLVLMGTVLIASNTRHLARFTPLFAASLLALYITFESPMSGMSINPARTFASAAWAKQWTAIWLYFAAPSLGMVLAAALYNLWFGAHRVLCAKLHHHNGKRCIFRCRYNELF